MQRSLGIVLMIMLVSLAWGRDGDIRYRVQYDTDNLRVRLLERAGEIEADRSSPGAGWMTPADYRRHASHLPIRKTGEDLRPRRSGPDTLGQVIGTWPLPAEVQSVRGLAFDGRYFFLADAQTNNEKIHKLDPADNFRVVTTFPAPGGTSALPWGVAWDGHYLRIADAIFDAIFKVDTSGVILSNTPTGGPVATGLAYRDGALWNGDIGQFSPPIPPSVYKTDTLGTLLATYPQSNTINGVAAHDSAIFVSRNVNNGGDIIALDPQTFVPLYSFPSPLDYPNGLAFDGRYLWTCGLNSGQRFIMQIDLGITPPPPPSVAFSTFDFVVDGQFNNRFNAAFDSRGKVHIVYATQYSTQSLTKEIRYMSNASGVWEQLPVTDDAIQDELPVIRVDGQDVVHLLWNGYQPIEGDVELWYTNNADGAFFPKRQITAKSRDGIDGHTWPDFAVDNQGVIHFTFVNSPLGAPEIYYGTHAQGITTQPVNISNNAVYDSDPRIVVDAQGHPHVFWTNNGSALYHASNAGGTWQSGLVAPSGSSRPAAAVDGQGVLHFAVTNGTRVVYGNNGGGAFQVTDTLAVHASNCFYPQFAVDDADRLHLTYHAFGDSSDTWPGNGEIFYTNTDLWNAGVFPQNISRQPAEQEIYPGLAATGDGEVLVGWARTGFDGIVFSDLRLATTLPDSGGYLAGKLRPSALAHHFGYVAPLDSASWQVTIRNTGIHPLTVSETRWVSSYDPWFEVWTDLTGPRVLEWGDSLVVSVTARINLPTSQADTVLLDGNLEVVSDDPVDPVTSIYLEVETEPLTEIEGDPGLIAESRLYRAWPNPFNPETRVEFGVRQGGRVTLRVFDVLGRSVRTLADGRMAAGRHVVRWDGRNDAGVSQASGVYFIHLRVGGAMVDTRRVMLVR